MNLYFTPSVLRVARVLRIGRLLRYFNSAKGIRRLLVALVISLPALFNIGALLFLVLFIYSIIGMANFGYVKKNGALNEVVNFDTFGNSMMVLFRLSTSAGWNEVLDSLMITPPHCDPTFGGIPNGNCGVPWTAVIFFVTFILITFLIIVNMYIAVILENFNQAHQQEESGITDEDIDMFYAVWQMYDPQATQYIDYTSLSLFIANLRPPLGVPLPNRVAVHNLNLPMKDGDKIHCVDVLQGLLKRVIGDIKANDSEHLNNMLSTIDKKLHIAFPQRNQNTTKTTTMERLAQTKAAVTIQRHVRFWLENYKLPSKCENVEMVSPADMLNHHIENNSVNYRSLAATRMPTNFHQNHCASNSGSLKLLDRNTFMDVLQEAKNMTSPIFSKDKHSSPTISPAPSPTVPISKFDNVLTELRNSKIEEQLEHEEHGLNDIKTATNRLTSASSINSFMTDSSSNSPTSKNNLRLNNSPSPSFSELYNEELANLDSDICYPLDHDAIVSKFQGNPMKLRSGKTHYSDSMDSTVTSISNISSKSIRSTMPEVNM